MSGSDSPKIFALDIRPEFHRPTWWRALVLVGGGLLVMALVAYGMWSYGAAFSILLLLGGAIGLAMLVNGVLDWRRAGRWQREINEGHSERDGDSTTGDQGTKLDRLYRAVVLRRFRAWFGEPAMVSDFRSAGAPLPRAVLIGSPKWTDRLPRSVSPDLVEPEFIRSRPTGMGLLRISPGLLIISIVWLFFAMLCYRFLAHGIASQSWGYIAFGALGGAALVMSVLAPIRKRGYATLGGGLIAGPSRIEKHSARHMRAWTPHDTIMLVHRTRPRSRELTVDLISDNPGRGPRRTTMLFYAPDDPGFQTLWRMWIHPLQVGELLERSSSAVQH